jgi:hypothetical protein
LDGSVANRCLKWGQHLKRSASKQAAGVFPLADIPPVSERRRS